MVCLVCRDGRHEDCPELIRQLQPGMTATELAGSSRCDCQHEARR